MINSGDTLRVIFVFIYLFIYLFFTEMCTKRLLNMCAKIWENILPGFWFMGFVSIWRNPGQSMHKQPQPLPLNLTNPSPDLNPKPHQNSSK